MGKLAVFALGTALLSVVLRESKREFVLPLQIAGGLLMLAAVFAAVRQSAISLLQLLSKTALAQTETELLLKGAGICVATELCAALCRESGNTALAEVLVLSGRLMTLLLALPLLENIIEIAVSFCE